MSDTSIRPTGLPCRTVIPAQAGILFWFGSGWFPCHWRRLGEDSRLRRNDGNSGLGFQTAFSGSL
ncbi:hypothetical protein HMPREF9120_02924 [Neisseria sp. oral taxon 020 str. F0370]|nr:hypothetical protein HMPREF9120_02924 [Neisseria sp. oral taxon 020 str. F0370]